MNISLNRHKLVTLDIEVYPNYLLIMFRKLVSGEIIYFEKYNDSKLNKTNVFQILKKYIIITFNGIRYDSIIVQAALSGYSNEELYNLNSSIINYNLYPWQVSRQTGLKILDFHHIDLIEIPPLKASLKIYAGRTHAARIKDLPLPPGTVITDDDRPILIEYCQIDNENTAHIFDYLREETDLRLALSKEYQIDLKSKSDAQIAEAVIKRELDTKYNIKTKKPKLGRNFKFRYKAPDSIVFESKELNDILDLYTSIPITLDSKGHTELDFDYKKNRRLTVEDYEQFWIDHPKRKRVDFEKWKKAQIKRKYKLQLGCSTYTLGIGGIHSCEKNTSHVADENTIIRDYDVTAFYPRIILNNRLFPKHLGEAFLAVYESLVNRRVEAKRKGNTVVNESLKIVINGSFGKLGQRHSGLYAPDLMAQVTITGQLTQLMLIEQLELNGISVVSANTDGIVVKMDKSKEDLAESIVSDWEFDTGYQMEATDYLSLNSRDVNNYIAVKDTPIRSHKKHFDEKVGVKGKGAYADQRTSYYKFRSNPTCDICTEAVKMFLKVGAQIEETIYQCQDITKFLVLRNVNGGAVKNGQSIGKAVRWYYGSDELDAIFYSTNGNRVPLSNGGVPLMELPKTFPSDVDYNWYISEAERILTDIGRH